MSTFETIQDILVSKFALDRSALTPDAGLDTLGIDSLAVLEMLFRNRRPLWPEDQRGHSRIPGDATGCCRLHRLTSDEAPGGAGRRSSEYFRVSMRRVAVTGLGVEAPLGHSVDELFTNLTAGRSGIHVLPILI